MEQNWNMEGACQGAATARAHGPVMFQFRSTPKTFVAPPNIEKSPGPYDPVAFCGRADETAEMASTVRDEVPTPLHGAAAAPSQPRQRTALNDARRLHGLLAAWAFSEVRGVPLDHHVTLLIGRTFAYKWDGWAEAQTGLMRALSRWLRGHGAPVAWIWCREEGDREGQHLHLLMHLRPELREPLRAFLHNVMAEEPGKGAVGIRWQRMGSRAERAEALAYDLKALPGVELLGIERAPCGVAGIKAAGMSETLGPAAQNAAGWKALALPFLASWAWPNGPPERKTTPRLAGRKGRKSVSSRPRKYSPSEPK